MLTVKNYTQQASAWGKGQLRGRKELQSLLLFALIEYDKHKNTNLLTTIQRVVSTVKTVPAKTIQAYIMEHANVRLVKGKDGKPTYKKEKGEPESKVTLPSVAWYDHDVNKKNDVNFNLERTEIAFVRKLIKNGITVDSIVSELRVIERNEREKVTKEGKAPIKVLKTA